MENEKIHDICIICDKSQRYSFVQVQNTIDSKEKSKTGAQYAKNFKKYSGFEFINKRYSDCTYDHKKGEKDIEAPYWNDNRGQNSL